MEKDFLDVYIAPLPLALPEPRRIEHEGRRAELLEISSEEARSESYFVWRLLERALFSRFGKTPTELGLRREATGRWVSPYLSLSLSHTKGALAAAVSSQPVGVDIEREAAPRAKSFAKKTLTERELSEYIPLGEEEQNGYLMSRWSMKEALFKMRGEGKFIPRNFDTQKGVRTEEVFLGGERFFLSVASDFASEAKIISFTIEN